AGQKGKKGGQGKQQGKRGGEGEVGSLGAEEVSCEDKAACRVFQLLLQKDPGLVRLLSAAVHGPGNKVVGGEHTPRELYGSGKAKLHLKAMYDEVVRQLGMRLAAGGEAAGATAGSPGPQPDLTCLVSMWDLFRSKGSERQLLDCMLNSMQPGMVTSPRLGPAAAAAAAQAAQAGQGEAGAQARLATDSALRRVVDDMLPSEQVGWQPEDDHCVVEEEGAYSDDDVPFSTPTLGAELGGGSLPGEGGSGAAQRGPEGLDPSALLQDLDWMFTITKDARQSWASLQQWAKMLVLERLRIIGKGQWTRAGGVKRLEPGDNRKLRGLDLWRLKIDKGGRILFEVAVEYL
ncbi:TPR and ankyrin repeat-containing protein 1, partial [Haematococcus lacustris]